MPNNQSIKEEEEEEEDILSTIGTPFSDAKKSQRHALPLVRAKTSICELLDNDNKEQIVDEVNNTNNRAVTDDTCGNKKNKEDRSYHCLNKEYRETHGDISNKLIAYRREMTTKLRRRRQDTLPLSSEQRANKRPHIPTGLSEYNKDNKKKNEEIIQ